MLKTRFGIWCLIVAVLLVPILPWLVFGPRLEMWALGLVSGENGSNFSRWLVGALGVGLLAGDSFLPIPSTLVMSALGLALGVVAGGIAASLGVFLSGTIAYLVCRRWGVDMARRIAGEKGLAKLGATMSREGALLIAVTRSVPVVQEATACLAGVTKMPPRLFFTALGAGCLPTGFAYAAIGASALRSQAWAIGLSLVVPLVTWLLIQAFVGAVDRGKI
ncbi:MAG: VTT domain-containing protein [Nibricoccus sp.]